MGWLGQQVYGQPHLLMQTKQIIMPPGEQKWITLSTKYTCYGSFGISNWWPASFVINLTKRLLKLIMFTV